MKSLILAVVLVLCWVGLVAWATAQTEAPPTTTTGKDDILRQLLWDAQDRLEWSDMEGAREVLQLMEWVVSPPPPSPAGAQEGECEWYTPHAWTPSTDFNLLEIVVDEYGPCCTLTADLYVYLDPAWCNPELIIWETRYCPDQGTTEESLLYRGTAHDYHLTYEADCRCFVMLDAALVSEGLDDAGNPIHIEHAVARCNMICGEEACRD